MAVWFLIAWTTLVMPFLALSVELPHLLTARLTVSHAARAALAAAFTQCSDLARYQTAAHELPRQQSAACMAQAAAGVYRLMLAQQSLAYPQAARLTLDTVQPAGETTRYRLRGCLPFTPRVMPDWSFPAEVCVVEVGAFEVRAGP